MNNLKIAIIVGGFPSISETFVLNHIVSLIEKGYDIKIFATYINNDPIRHDIVDKYNLTDKVILRPNPHIGYKRVFKIIYYLYKYKKKIFKLLKTLNPKYYGKFALKGYIFFEAVPFLYFKHNHFDIIHAHFGENGNKVAFLKNIGIISSKLVVTFHGSDINDRIHIKKVNNYILLKGNADALIFNSYFLMNKFKNIININSPHYRIPVGIDINKFYLKEYNSISHKRISFITIGRLVDCKGIDLVLKAFSRINKNSFIYNIVGDGPNKEMLSALSNNLGISNNVIFHGSLTQEKIIDILKSNDVFILFGKTDKRGIIDAQGLVVQEAHACGLPSIVSDGGGLSEGVINNKTGFIIKEGDVNALIDKIQVFIDQPQLIKTMGIEASLFAQKNYDQEKLNHKIIQIYDSLLKN